MTAPFGPAPVLVLAPHPDDESLGCGLMLAARWADGAPTHVMCLTDGGASHRSAEWPRARLAALRLEELRCAVSALGGNPSRDITWLGHPDAALHRLHGPAADLARDIGRAVDDASVGTLVVPSPRDPHCDHVAAAAAAIAVAASRPRLQVVQYPIWSRWHERSGETPIPDIVLELPAHRAAKRQAIAAHRSQAGQVVRDDPAGFAMPAGFANYFATRPEHFHEVAW